MAKKTATKARDDMTPAVVLRAFFSAMCLWERKAFKASEGPRELSDAVLRKTRKAIVSEYCTPRRRVYSEPLAYGDPPEYDPDTEEILEAIEESPSRVV